MTLFLENISAAILNDINVKVDAQDFVMLLGNNGAGKSTLLHTLAGHIPPTVGRIKLNNQDLTQVNRKKRAQYIRYIPQNPMHGLCESLSIEENLLFAMRSAKASWQLAATAVHRQKLQALLHHVDLRFVNRLQEPVANLSGGERQALSIVMATFTAPRVLLLDEPTAALDPTAAQKLLKFIQHLHHKCQLTIIMVTHRLEEACFLGNRFLFLREGKIVQDVSQNKCSTSREQLCNLFAQCYL